MWTDALFWLYDHGWMLLWIGANVAGAGTVGLALSRAGLILGPDPELPAVVVVEHPLAVVAHVEPIHTPLRCWDTDVIPRTPGATPKAVCPTCGGAFGNCACYGNTLTIVIPPVPTEEERRRYTGRHREDGDTRPMVASAARAKAEKP